jgi:Flp pilus assembly protein TadB
MKSFHRIWQEIISGQNLDIYINIALTVVVATLGIFGIANQSLISSATIVILALLLTSLLVNRHNSENIQSAISKFEKTETFPV